MNFRKIVISAVSAFALVVVVGCSSSSTADSSGASCGAAGDKNCPNDTAATQAAVDLCNKCLTQEKAYASCEGLGTAKPSCDASGKSVAQMVDQTKCMTELNAASKCFSGM